MIDNDSLLQVFGTIDYNMKRIGISDLCSESSPTFVEDGGNSYSTHRSTWICVFVSQTIPLRWKHWAIYHRYSCLSITLTRKDEDNIYLGLQQHGQRVRWVALQAPPLSFRMLFEPMDKLFPRLEDLSLLSTATEEDQEIGLVPPETFQAPDLHRLALHGIGLSTGSPLLTSAIALSTLSLTHIGASCYFPPGHLVKQLQGLPHLEELSIGFSIPIPLPSTEGDLLPPPIPPVTLAALRRLTFRGVDIYFDNLVAQVNTPVLERLSLTLFFDLTFTLVNLTEFIHRTEGFECLVAKVIFRELDPSIILDV